MGGACGVRVGERRNAYRVLVVRPDDLGIGVRMMLKWISKKQEGDGDWFGLFQNVDKWRAVVSTVMNLIQ
jgi:hypothetical protein